MILIENIDKVQLSGSALKNYRRKKKVLDLLYHHETLSATDISKKIGVSLPTSLSLLKELGEYSLVELRGSGESKGGRKPMLFGLKNDSILVVACELDRFSGKIGIYDSHNNLIAPISSVNTNIDDIELSNKIHAQVLDIVNDNRIDLNRIFGIGLAMPGLVDEEKGINYTIKNIQYRNVAQRLRKKFNKLVYINNDARMQAYGEFVFGKAKNYRNALVLNWNWGLGLGMILDGKIYNGTTGFAGELSHIKFVDDGDLCICGKRGCLETVTSAYVLLRKAQEAISEGKISQLTANFKNNIQDLKVEDIIDAAKLGDELSISLLNGVGLALGKALSNTIQLFNPDIIVLGGVMSDAKQFVLTPIQQAINRHCLEQISGNTKIIISEIWGLSGLLGITAMLFKRLFSNMYN